MTTTSSKYILPAIIGLFLTAFSMTMFAHYEHHVLGKSHHVLRSASALHTVPKPVKERPFFGPALGHRAKGDSRTFGKCWTGDADYTSLLDFTPRQAFLSVVLLNDSAPSRTVFTSALSFRGPPAV